MHPGRFVCRQHTIGFLQAGRLPWGRRERDRQQMRCGEKPTINGDGKQSRDFVYVKDLAAVNIAALFKDGISHAVLNVGTGRVATIVELYKQLCQLQGVPAEMAFGPARQGDIRHSRADVTQLGRVLGYVPNTSLTLGLSLSMKAMLEEMNERAEATEAAPLGRLALQTAR